MAVTVSGKNYTQITDCDSTTADGSWSLTAVLDTSNKREGTGSVCFIAKTTAVTWYFTPTSPINMSGTKHLRCWFLDTTAGSYLTIANGGMRIGVGDGTNIGYWNILGSENYTGGWVNVCVDVSKTVDSGTKPTDMSTVDRIYFQTNKTVAGKNTENVWIDNLCLCDGLIAYGDDGGSYFDFEDIFAADDALSLGIGIVRKIGGQYFSTGSLEIGDSAGTNSTKFNALSQVLVFEDRPVNANLYAINVVDNGTGTTEFILGDKSGTAGIQGCVIRSASASQTPKFDLDGFTDTDVDNFKLYASVFYGADSIKFAPVATNVEVIGCSFESCGQVIASSAPVTGCFFINTSDADAALLWNEDIDIADCAFIGNTIGAGIEMPSAVGTPYIYDNLTFSGNTYDVYNSSGSAISINKNNGSDPTTYEGSTVTFLGTAVPVSLNVTNVSGTDISGALVLLTADSGGSLPYEASVTITNSGTTASVSHTTHGMNSGDYVEIQGASLQANNGVFQISNVTTNAYDYTMSSTPGSSPTGTITSTFVALYGTTDANGDVSTNRVYNSAQPIKGKVRKSSTAPYYKTAQVVGSISTTVGFSGSAIMIADQ